MVTTANYDALTEELQRSQVRLHDELIFAPQRYGDEYFFHIENPATTKFFRVNEAEYSFISLFDGKTSFAQALAIAAQHQPANAISEHRGVQIIQWMLEHGLASLGRTTISRISEIEPDSPESWIQKCNPFWLKFPLGDPSTLLGWILKTSRWLFHPLLLMTSLVIIVLGVAMGVANYQTMFESSTQILTPGNWISILLIWALLKLGHELAHGLACLRFGGNVREAGLIFILMAPMAYVDVTSSWRFGSRWKRIAVASAGMYFELLIASICILAWFNTSSPEIKQTLFTVVTMAGISTVLFNANPLMKFDGYFILSDLLRVPNLYQSGLKVVGDHMNWLFFGQASSQSCVEIRQKTLGLMIYGYLAAGWKVIIAVGLTITASVMLGGAGILLAIVGVFLWFGMPLAKLAKEVVHRKTTKPHSVVRMTIVATLLASIAGLIWFVVPSPFGTPCGCVVDYEDTSRVRSTTSGFVVDIFVSNGQQVVAQTPLLRLTNEELDAEIAELRSELAQHATRERIALSEQNTAEVQNASKDFSAVQETLEKKLQEQRELLVLAPKSGRVVALNIEHLQGRYFKQGEVLLMIGDESAKEILISVPSEQVNTATALVGKQVPIELGSRRRFYATIDRVNPKASRQIQQAKLTTLNGGSVPVRQASSNSNDAPDYELLTPHYQLVAKVSSQTAAKLFAGERGHCRMRSKSHTLGQSVYLAIEEWLATRIAAARAEAL